MDTKGEIMISTPEAGGNASFITLEIAFPTEHELRSKHRRERPLTQMRVFGQTEEGLRGFVEIGQLRLAARVFLGHSKGVTIRNVSGDRFYKQGNIFYIGRGIQPAALPGIADQIVWCIFHQHAQKHGLIWKNDVRKLPSACAQARGRKLIQHTGYITVGHESDLSV